MRLQWPIKDHSQWERWYAWHPVRVGNEIVWREYVERRFVSLGDTYTPDLGCSERWGFEYRYGE